MPKVSSAIQLIEDWIELNGCKSKPSTFKILIHEKDGENFYTMRVEGVRYGQFAIHRAHDGFRVTHIPTGGICVEPFSSEKSARRFIFCIKQITDWRKIRWGDTFPHIEEPLLGTCLEAYDYCAGKDGDFEELIATIKLLSPDEQEPEVVEPVAVEFGEGVVPKRKAKVEVEEDGWGVTIT